MLASASPRRQSLVALLNLPWRVAAANVDEENYVAGVAEPSVAAVNVALAKARATRAEPDEIVVAADTLVVVDDDILAKPRTPEEARGMLERLRGRAHEVMTGVVVHHASRIWAGVVDTRVVMRSYSETDMRDYIARGEPFDKAGGYAVQDQTFRPVEKLDGCYLNVVGLPLCAVAAGLNALGGQTAPATAPPCAYCEQGETLVRSGS